MFCKNCRAALADNYNVCPKCGTALVTPSAPVQEEITAQQPPVAPPVQPVVQQPVQPVMQQPVQPVAPVVQMPAQPIPVQVQKEDHTRDVMSIGQFLVYLILSGIPIVNVICCIVWLCSSRVNKNKKHLILAQLIYTVIIGAVAGIIAAIVAALGVNFIDQIQSYLR